MCLAYPMKIIEIRDDRAVAQAHNIKREIGLELVSNLRKGDYVMVHAGFAIAKLDTKEALKTIEVFKEYHNALRKSFKK